MSRQTFWNDCLLHLEGELSSNHFNTWIRPLQAEKEKNKLYLLAPNRFVKDWVDSHYLNRITEIAGSIGKGDLEVILKIGSKGISDSSEITTEKKTQQKNSGNKASRKKIRKEFTTALNPKFTFHSHVAGKSNQLARAAALQVGENPGQSYNPLFIYGGSGVGKTHLMQSAGNLILQHQPTATIAYVRSEFFVQGFVKALQHGTIDDFKLHYRSVDALLIDDIHFFARKNQSQEEFFHTFNSLLDLNRQIIMTSDRMPQEIEGLEERLVSRFGSGLTVPIEPPELETRVAILITKASEMGINLPQEVAFFISRQIRSNVRELEGGLNRIIASMRFTGREIDLDLAKEALKDIVGFQQRMISLENIQKTVAEYFKIRLSDIRSKKRTRNITRPRQIAMSLSKELTNHSLPEIGDAFGGRDHTTVIHAVKKVSQLTSENPQLNEDYENLLKILSN
ncbi:MAG: chromosomal replication initiator protein DnaA [Gammaproteobacteria bacterium]|nr:chromosomal replication initiator protein DnaA [Gammaproteobacteria bacterium]MDX2486995.1 chromosomal replication initiator protein DnaA [Gammaproteobacteria bacterium]